MAYCSNGESIHQLFVRSHAAVGMKLTFWSRLKTAGVKRAGLSVKEEEAEGVLCLSFDPYQPLGIGIANYGSGIHVIFVDPQGAADKMNIQVGN